MINKRVDRIKKYCCEDISLIENYNEAINDKEQTWEIHHKLEIELNKTQKALIEQNLYWKRPASELIFLTRKEHKALHQSIHSNFNSKGKTFTEEHKKRISEARKLYWAKRKAKQSSNQIP